MRRVSNQEYLTIFNFENMNKNYKTVGVQAYINKRAENNERLCAIADVMEAEKREANDAEKAEIEAIKRENAVLDLKIAGAQNGRVVVTDREAAFDAFLREALKAGVTETPLKRTDPYVHTTGSTNANAMIPVSVKDVIEPLEQGLIMSLVGIPTYTGLQGSYVYPTIDAVEAEIAGEDVALSAAMINFGKIQPNPKRVGVSIHVTSQLINQTEGVAYNIVMSQLPKAVSRTLNKAMFNTDANLALTGPFKAIAAVTGKALSAIKTKEDRTSVKHVTFAGALPTYAELLALKGLVLAKGVSGENMAYVMDEYTKSQLESTPRESGSGLMIVENGKISGIPVFCTNYIDGTNTVNIGFGCFGNTVCQGFGDFRLVVDPYTNAKKDEVILTLNSDWSMDVLRAEGFALGTCTLPA